MSLGFTLQVLSDGDDLTVLCATCGAEARNEYLGYEQGTPSPKATCQTCWIRRVRHVALAVGRAGHRQAIAGCRRRASDD